MSDSIYRPNWQAINKETAFVDQISEQSTSKWCTFAQKPLWHDRGTNQDLVHNLEPLRKGVQSSLPLPPPHCPLLLLKGRLAPRAQFCLLGWKRSLQFREANPRGAHQSLSVRGRLMHRLRPGLLQAAPQTDLLVQPPLGLCLPLLRHHPRLQQSVMQAGAAAIQTLLLLHHPIPHLHLTTPIHQLALLHQGQLALQPALLLQ